ncbi:MAG: hypothetical protein WC648_00185 [Candidatus Paceibacterota bacterium]
MNTGLIVHIVIFNGRPYPYSIFFLIGNLKKAKLMIVNERKRNYENII